MNNALNILITCSTKCNR